MDFLPNFNGIPLTNEYYEQEIEDYFCHIVTNYKEEDKMEYKEIDKGSNPYFPNENMGYSTIIENTPIEEVEHYVEIGSNCPKSYWIHINCKNNLKNLDFIIDILNYQREILLKKQTNANQDN